MDTTRDIPFMFSDFGVPVVMGQVSSLGLFDYVTKAEGFGGELAEVLVNEPSVLVASVDFPSARKGDAITVNGTAYTIRDRHASNDGKLIRFMLRGTP